MSPSSRRTRYRTGEEELKQRQLHYQPPPDLKAQNDRMLAALKRLADPAWMTSISDGDSPAMTELMARMAFAKLVYRSITEKAV